MQQLSEFIIEFLDFLLGSLGCLITSVHSVDVLITNVENIKSSLLITLDSGESLEPIVSDSVDLSGKLLGSAADISESALPIPEAGISHQVCSPSILCRRSFVLHRS